MIKKCSFFSFVFILNIYLCLFKNNDKSKYKQDDLTLVSAYYRIKSKHTSEQYLKWINNIVLLNKSIVFFTNKEFMETLKEMRPKQLHYKTVFIELEIKDFFSYKNFYKEFNHSFEIDTENRYHTVPLYMIWAEKCMFLKKAISKNYFNSKCFYWIDIGYFREEKNEMKKYLNNWPSTKKCFEDKRLLMGQVKNFSIVQKEKIVNFDIDEHKRLQLEKNVAGNLFGGQVENIKKFIDFYYDSIRLFLKKGIFIGKDQNIFTYIAFSHSENINLVPCETYNELKKYLS